MERKLRDGTAVHQHFTAVGRVVSHEQFQNRGFASPRVPHDTEELTLVHLEGNAVEHLDGGVRVGEVDIVELDRLDAAFEGHGILAVNGESTPYFQTLVEALGRHAGETVTLTVTRSGGDAAPDPELGQPLPSDGTLALDAEVSADGKLGFYPIEVESLDGFQFVERSFGPVDALSEGARKTKTTLTNYVSSLRFLFRPGGTQQLGGFITLGSIFSPEWDWRSFWNITALLSIILAFMNLLPIPALDGGHVMFLLYEMMSGRKPSDKVMEYGQLIGLLLVGSLMLLANGNDLWKWFTGRF